MSEFSVRTFGIAKDSKFDSVIGIMYDAIENLRNKMAEIGFDAQSSVASDMRSIQSSQPSQKNLEAYDTDMSFSQNEFKSLASSRKSKLHDKSGEKASSVRNLSKKFENANNQRVENP